MRLKSPLRSLAFLAILSLLLLGPLALYLARNPSQALADTFLKFDEGYGTSSAVNDSNGAVSAGSITGATWKTDDLCFDGKCLYYDGNQDFVSFGDDDDLDFAGADSFSITGWFRHGPASATNVIVAKLLGSDNNGGYRIQMEADGDITCEIEDDDANTAIDDSISSTAATYDDNRWHHFACVKSGTASLTLYIDAQQIIQDASLDGSSTLANVESLYIGIDGDGTSNDYTGFIDEIKIYRSARSASDIKADFLKNSPLEGSAASFGINDQSFLSDGLVGYWPMDEASWTNDCATDTVMDSSGNSYSGDSCPDISGPTGGSAGKYGNAGTFDGTEDYITVPSNDTLRFLNSNFTVSIWVYPTATQSHSFLGKGQGTIRTGYHLYGNGTGQLRAMYSDTTDSADHNFQFGTYTPSTWYHLVLVADKTNRVAKGYVNGVYGGEMDITGIADDISTTYALQFGRNQSYYAAAKIDEIRMFNRALTPREISQLYNWGPGPVAYWKMDENTGTANTYDSSGNSNTGTMNGSMTASDWVPGQFGSALDFDGSDDSVSVADASDSYLDFNSTETFSGGAWVYIRTMPGSGNQDAIITKWDELSTLRGYRLIVENDDADATGNFQMDIYDESADQTITATGANDTVSENTWYHVAFTFNGGVAGTADDLKLYVNGVLVDGNDANGSFLGLEDVANDFAIGDYDVTDVIDNNTAFTGIIDNVLIYNYLRTPSQIIQDMNAGHPAPGSPVGSAIAYWKLDEGYGTTANDTGYSNSDLTLSNVSWTDSGKFGKAFTGASNYRLSKTDDPDLDFTASEGMTLSAWFKRDTVSNAEYLIYKVDSNEGYGLWMDSDGDIVYGISDTNSGSFPEESIGDSLAKNYDDNAWHQAIAVKDGTSSIKLYVDGVEIASDTSLAVDATLENAGTFYLGDANGTDGADEWLGTIDEVKIYRVALTADQVKTEYNQGKSAVMGATSTDSSGNPSWSAVNEYCPPGQGSSCTPPVGEWKADEGTGTGVDAVKDTSEKSWDGDTEGMTNANWVPGKFGSALYYDIVDDGVYIGTYTDINSASAVTVSAWIRPDFIQTYNGDADGDHPYIFSNTNFELFFNINQDDFTQTVLTSGGASTLHTSDLTWTAGTWHLLTAIYDGSNTIFYFDGKLESIQDTVNGTLNANTNESCIGTPGNGTGNCNPGSVTYDPWLGAIDTLRVYNYVRTAEQISWEFNQGASMYHYKLDEGTGATAYNTALNSNGDAGGVNLTLFPVTLGNTTTTQMWNNGASGKRNGSVDFDGLDDYAASSNSVLLNPTSADTYTHASWGAWVKPATATTSDTIIHKNNEFKLTTDADGKPVCSIYYSADWHVIATGSTALATNSWSRVICTYDGANGYVYVNSQQTGTVAETNSITSSSSTALNLARDSAGSGYFDGLMDEVKIWAYTLNATQIKLDYNDGAVRFSP